MPKPCAPQHLPPQMALGRRAVLALFGLAALPFARSAKAAQARLGHKVARALGPDATARLLDARGAIVGSLPAGARKRSTAEDFRAGRTLIVGGALVAQTEAVVWLLAAGFAAQGAGHP